VIVPAGIVNGEASPAPPLSPSIDDLLNHHRLLLLRTPGGKVFLEDDAALFLEAEKVMWAPAVAGEGLFERKVSLEPDSPSTPNHPLLPGWESSSLPQGRYPAS